MLSVQLCTQSCSTDTTHCFHGVYGAVAPVQLSLCVIRFSCEEYVRKKYKIKFCLTDIKHIHCCQSHIIFIYFALRFPSAFSMFYINHRGSRGSRGGVEGGGQRTRITRTITANYSEVAVFPLRKDTDRSECLRVT